MEKNGLLPNFFSRDFMPKDGTKIDDKNNAAILNFFRLVESQKYCKCL
jgi:hypothetical protein